MVPMTGRESAKGRWEEDVRAWTELASMFQGELETEHNAFKVFFWPWSLARGSLWPIPPSWRP